MCNKRFKLFYQKHPLSLNLFLIVKSFLTEYSAAGALQCQTCTEKNCSTTVTQNCSSETMCITASILGNLFFHVLGEMYVLQNDVRVLSALPNCTPSLQPHHLEVKSHKSTRLVRHRPCVQPQALGHFPPALEVQVQLHPLDAATQIPATQKL